jgi:hypothetical protein
MKAHIETDVTLGIIGEKKKTKEAAQYGLYPFVAHPNKSKNWDGGKVLVWASTAYEAKQMIVEKVKPSKKDLFMCSPMRADITHTPDY